VDIFAASLILYYLYTGGKHPFSVKTAGPKTHEESLSPQTEADWAKAPALDQVPM